ncbi:helix-turn-helix domain-containing protein [Pedobacter yulinensis]|nr:AraC family transcriptional regulator [Pedobacter yulinensis]
MTFYLREVQKIRHIVYGNQGQLEAVIGARRFLDGNLDGNINLDLLSENSYISKFHLLRLFKQYYGQTPRQYLTDRRIERSKICLRRGMGIAQTCYAVGFESPNSFSTLFKSRTGVSPTQFKKEQFSQRSMPPHSETSCIEFKT